MYIYICIYTCIHVYIHIYIHMLALGFSRLCIATRNPRQLVDIVRLDTQTEQRVNPSSLSLSLYIYI